MKRTGKIRRIALSTAVIFGLYGMYCVGFVVAEKSKPQVAAVAEHIDVYDLWKLTNAEREKAGVKPLALNPILTKSAQAKCDDMVVKGYFDHYAPTGERWTHFVYDADPSYKSKAISENIAIGDVSAGGVINGWMHSPTHRDAILDTKYASEGFAVCTSRDFDGKGARLMTVEHFAD